MTMVQTHLSQGCRNLKTWLPKDRRVKPGAIVSLERELGRWRVEEQFGEIELGAINRGWNNNI